jgi:hypothetical protein
VPLPEDPAHETYTEWGVRWAHPFGMHITRGLGEKAARADAKKKPVTGQTITLLRREVTITRTEWEEVANG